MQWFLSRLDPARTRRRPIPRQHVNETFHAASLDIVKYVAPLNTWFTHPHASGVYLLKTKRTRSSIKLRPKKACLFYRDLQVSFGPYRKECSMTVRLAQTYICHLHGPYLYGEGPSPEDWERCRITLSLLCPCHDYYVTPLK